MKRLSLTLALFALLLVPGPAAAAPGWELQQINSFVHGNHEAPNTTYARRCGSSVFGVWRFSVGVTIRGVWGGVTWRVRIASDGRGRRASGIRFRGRMPRHLRAETRSLLRRSRFRYAGGASPRVEVVAGGRVEQSMPFRPRSRRC